MRVIASRRGPDLHLIPWRLIGVVIKGTCQAHPSGVCDGEHHPFDQLPAGPDVIKRAVFESLTSRPTGTSSMRRRELQRWERLANMFQKKEDRLHGSLQDKPKRILRKVKEGHLLKEGGWADTQLVDDLVQGMPIFGEIPKSNVFKDKVPAHKLSPEELVRDAPAWKKRLIASIKPSADLRFDEATVAATSKEVSSGSMSEIVFEEELQERCGKSVNVSRRFSIEQGEEPDSDGEPGATRPRYRSIDDLSES